MSRRIKYVDDKPEREYDPVYLEAVLAEDGTCINIYMNGVQVGWFNSEGGFNVMPLSEHEKDKLPSPLPNVLERNNHLYGIPVDGLYD